MKLQKLAFTLAEVLITLGIIGVISALTLPSLISKYQEKVWLNQFKTTYSILSQAYIQAYNDYGLPDEWGLNGTTKENTYKSAKILTSYLKLATDYGQVGQNLKSFPYTFLGLDGTDLGSLGNTLKGQDPNAYIFTLTNGAVITIDDTGNIGDYNKILVSVIVDTNGFKKPNQMGKDLFLLYLNSNNNYPEITGYPLNWVSQNNCTKTPHVGWWSGGACATWVIKRGNMDYLHRELTSEEWPRY